MWQTTRPHCVLASRRPRVPSHARDLQDEPLGSRPPLPKSATSSRP
jgi:hypothetical protein